jgi:hypothetical protein
VWPRLVGESGRSSSSSSRLPRIVVFPAHRLPRAVKATADGRPATRRGELMPARLYIAAYRAWPATFASISPNQPLHLLHPPPRAMAGYRSDEDDATNNGFGRRSLHQWEGRLLYAAGYMAPPHFRAPGGWRLSAGGIPIPPPPSTPPSTRSSRR